MLATNRCLIVGDGGVGKTTLITKLCLDKIHNEYVPTILDVYEYLTLSSKSGSIKVQFMDLPGQEDHHQIRKYCYQEQPQTLFLCYSTASKISFENILDFWLPEISKFIDLDKVNTFLIGTQTDIRNQIIINGSTDVSSIVTADTGKKFAETLYATYIECSSVENTNINQLKCLISEKVDATQKNKKVIDKLRKYIKQREKLMRDEIKKQEKLRKLSK
jgi:small GTP-binding protein